MPHISFAVSAILGALTVPIVTANALVWAVFCYDKRLRTISNRFLVSLATAHLLVGLLGIPLYLLSFVYDPLLKASNAVYFYALCTAITNMFAVTYERYLSIVRPLSYDRRMTKKIAFKLIFLSWTFPIVPAFVDSVWDEFVGMEQFSLFHKIYHGVLSGSFLLMATLLAIANLAILKTAKQQLRTIRALNVNAVDVPASGTIRQHRRSKNAILFFLLVVGSFFVCWTPRICCSIYEIVHEIDLYNSRADHVTLCIAMLNHVIDPIIYMSFKKDFKRAAVLLGHRLGCFAGPEPNHASQQTFVSSSSRSNSGVPLFTTRSSNTTASLQFSNYGNEDVSYGR